MPRNPYFTGREELLTHLHETLTRTKAQPQAVSGLGGIGKTQTALEYAYRYGNDYQYIFWVKAEPVIPICVQSCNIEPRNARFNVA